MSELIQLAVFLLVCFGVTNIITSGKIFAWFRRLVKPVPVLGYWIACPMCVGLPVGVFWWYVGLWAPTGVSELWDAVAAGAASSGWCWTVRVKLHALGEDNL